MFKKLKSLFIIEEENQSSGSDKTNIKSDESSSSSNEGTVDQSFEKPQFEKGSVDNSKLDEKFVNRLLGAIEENNLEGFDYLEYKQALQNLNKVEMDEKTKFTSALAVAKTMGASKTELIASAEHYLSILAKEENKFIEAFKNQISRQVTARSKEIQQKEAGIEEKKAMIKKLEQEIEAQRNQLESMKSSVDGAKAKVEETKTRFYQAYHIVSEQIKDDLEKIKTFLS